MIPTAPLLFVMAGLAAGGVIAAVWYERRSPPQFRDYQFLYGWLACCTVVAVIIWWGTPP